MFENAPPLANLDHNSVFLQVKMKGTKDKVKSTHRCYWRYDLADLDKARERIEDTDWNTLLKNDDINVSWINWKNKFYEIMYETFAEPKRRTWKSCVIYPQMPRNFGVL